MEKIYILMNNTRKRCFNLLLIVEKTKPLTLSGYVLGRQIVLIKLCVPISSDVLKKSIV